ncbi:MAG TPA: hypothetical protein PLI65_00545 [Bacteroidales bacterium]|nr:hypothetical protein [Bacteroidales bacterium]HPR58436.1 hypothetical protein [Bacteroidales bacterium]HRW97805.1 hypothetical protein [Bacteroidales bacterium]
MLKDQTIDRNKRTTGNFFIIALNSTAYFLISFIIMYLLGQFLTAVVALQYDFKSVLYYYKLVWAIDSYEWTTESVKLLFSLAPLLSLLLGIIFLVIYIILYDDRSNLKQFFLWGFAHGMVWFFGALIAGVILDQGFGYVIMYMYFKDTGKLVLSLLSLTALLLVAAFTTKWFLFSGNAYFNQLNEHNRAFFTFSQIIIPAVLGTTLLIGSKLPLITYYELFTLLLMIAFIIPMLTNFHNFNTFYFDEFPIEIKTDKKAIITAILMLVAFRAIFEFGIMIGSSS